jgi:hypothetical protein
MSDKPLSNQCLSVASKDGVGDPRLREPCYKLLNKIRWLICSVQSPYSVGRHSIQHPHSPTTLETLKTRLLAHRHLQLLTAPQVQISCIQGKKTYTCSTLSPCYTFSVSKCPASPLMEHAASHSVKQSKPPL